MSVRVPRLRPGCDIKSLPLTPAEGFLLSRIDGILDEHDLGMMTGLDAVAVAGVLERLRSLGAIEISDGAGRPAPAASSPARPAPAPAASAARPAPAPAPAAPSPARPADAALRSDPAVLDEPVELAPEKRQRILDLFSRLDEVSYYELLGVTEEAEKKQIKSAYYALAPEFHPDTYFRKQLGSYKAKIEAIFSRITLAHDVLTSKQRRAEYDEYIEQTRQNRSMSALIEQTSRDIDSIASELDASVRAMVGDNPGPGARGSGSPEGARRPEPRADARPPVAGAAAGKAPSSPTVPAVTIQDRRELLAKKLSGGLRRPSSMTMPAVTIPSSSAGNGPDSSGPSPESVRAAEQLKSRYEAARDEARRVQVERYVAVGRNALDRKDYASAANAYRIAASLDPESEELQRVCAETQHLAAVALAEGYLKQAQYEENHERWEDAAISYSKVCAGRPDEASPHERAAFAILKANGNVRRAVELARRAVELAPDAPLYRLTLARAYSAAGLAKSANGEIARAAELARSDAKMKELVAQAREQARHGKLV
ncbi:MAG: DnaJ domain-containing protein [Polyangiaceae bacterium]|nr:DnaJ domain-containing protein [Polyangiaceae bacterium]